MIYRYVPAPGEDDYEYWRGFAQAWATTEPIVNVEHDNEFSPLLVDELLSCSHPLCSHAYRMHIPRTYWAHSHHSDGMDGFWISEGEEWAVYSAIGFCKVSPAARVGPLERSTWRGVELAVNRATEGLWHLHWPAIEHYHTA